MIAELVYAPMQKSTKLGAALTLCMFSRVILVFGGLYARGIETQLGIGHFSGKSSPYDRLMRETSNYQKTRQRSPLIGSILTSVGKVSIPNLDSMTRGIADARH